MHTMNRITLLFLCFVTLTYAQSNNYFTPVPSTGFTYYSESSLTVAEGVIYSFGGDYYNPGVGPADINSLVASDDGGRTWTSVNSAVTSSLRHASAITMHELNGVKHLVLACGAAFGGPNSNDVYYAQLENLGPASGQQWTKSTVTAGTAGMYTRLESLLVGNNRLLVHTAGMYSWAACSNAVYTIADVANGAWKRQPDGPWTPRFRYGTTTISGGTQVMLIGGSNCDFTTYYNDVYIGSYSIAWGTKAYDPAAVTISWRLVTAAAPFSARTGFGITRDKLVYIAGGMDAKGNLNDLWVSPDNGQSWMLMASNAGYTPRFDHLLAAIGQKLVIIGGQCAAGGVVCDSTVAYEAF